MSKYTEKLLESFEIAKERLEHENRLNEASVALLANIILRVAVERPIKFAEPHTLAEEALRRYNLPKD